MISLYSIRIDIAKRQNWPMLLKLWQPRTATPFPPSFAASSCQCPLRMTCTYLSTVLALVGARSVVILQRVTKELLTTQNPLTTHLVIEWGCPRQIQGKTVYPRWTLIDSIHSKHVRQSGPTEVISGDPSQSALKGLICFFKPSGYKNSP